MCRFHRNYLSNRRNIIKFVISGSELVKIDILLAQDQNFYFWRPFWIFFENAVYNIGRSYRPILLIFNSKHWKTTLYLVLNFEENQSKIATMRVPEWKSTKWPLWRYRFRNYKNREEITGEYLPDICRKFNQNRPIRLGCRDYTHRHTDRQTDRQTDTQTPSVRSQHIQSKFDWI